jgi:uncharacterized metal-binding protein YceD (DUF177 family)
MPESQGAQEPEFSRPVEVDRIGPEGVSLEIEADPGEREALARRFGLASVDRLTASVSVSPLSRKLFRVEGRLEGEVVQTCVVTLDPVPARLTETFSALFGEGGPGLAALLAAEEDTPEPIQGGAIDLGETVAQHLSLALDPYPRKPGAQLAEGYGQAAGAGAEPRQSPFAALGALKKGPR